MLYTIENTVKIGEPKRVFLDGEEITSVIECDTEAGYAICHVINEDGSIKVDGEFVVRERKEGKVTVEPMGK